MPSHQRTTLVRTLAAVVLTGIPWVLGLFFMGVLAGLALDINPYISASLVIGLWVLGLTMFVAKGWA